ncbi:hypothetical protein NMS23_003481 [Vibrio parahaemolyticus]|nr:hypothetical protein [Vibrio parahaemolyticus]EJL6404664.1 hypothetical protein [Vibrio parahaemolyticus]
MSLIQLPEIKHLLAIGVGVLYLIKFSAISAFCCWGGMYITQNVIWSQRVGLWVSVAAIVGGLTGFLYGVSLSEWVGKEWT